jgi:hypothetical protein
VAQSEPEPQDSQLRDALLDAVSGALRILGGMVQMAAGVTRVVTVAVRKGCGSGREGCGGIGGGRREVGAEADATPS